MNRNHGQNNSKKSQKVKKYKTITHRDGTKSVINLSHGKNKQTEQKISKNSSKYKGNHETPESKQLSKAVERPPSPKEVKNLIPDYKGQANNTFDLDARNGKRKKHRNNDKTDIGKENAYKIDDSNCFQNKKQLINDDNGTNRRSSDNKSLNKHKKGKNTSIFNENNKTLYDRSAHVFTSDSLFTADDGGENVYDSRIVRVVTKRRNLETGAIETEERFMPNEGVTVTEEIKELQRQIEKRFNANAERDNVYTKKNEISTQKEPLINPYMKDFDQYECFGSSEDNTDLHPEEKSLNSPRFYTQYTKKIVDGVVFNEVKYVKDNPFGKKIDKSKQKKFREFKPQKRYKYAVVTKPVVHVKPLATVSDDIERNDGPIIIPTESNFLKEWGTLNPPLKEEFREISVDPQIDNAPIHDIVWRPIEPVLTKIGDKYFIERVEDGVLTRYRATPDGKRIIFVKKDTNSLKSPGIKPSSDSHGMYKATPDYESKIEEQKDMNHDVDPSVIRSELSPDQHREYIKEDPSESDSDEKFNTADNEKLSDMTKPGGIKVSKIDVTDEDLKSIKKKIKEAEIKRQYEVQKHDDDEVPRTLVSSNSSGSENYMPKHVEIGKGQALDQKSKIQYKPEKKDGFELPRIPVLGRRMYSDEGSVTENNTSGDSEVPSAQHSKLPGEVEDRRSKNGDETMHNEFAWLEITNDRSNVYTMQMSVNRKNTKSKNDVNNKQDCKEVDISHMVNNKQSSQEINNEQVKVVEVDQDTRTAKHVLDASTTIQNGTHEEIRKFKEVSDIKASMNNHTSNNINAINKHQSYASENKIIPEEKSKMPSDTTHIVSQRHNNMTDNHIPVSKVGGLTSKSDDIQRNPSDINPKEMTLDYTIDAKRDETKKVFSTNESDIRRVSLGGFDISKIDERQYPNLFAAGSDNPKYDQKSDDRRHSIDRSPSCREVEEYVSNDADVFDDVNKSDGGKKVTETSVNTQLKETDSRNVVDKRKVNYDREKQEGLHFSKSNVLPLREQPQTNIDGSLRIEQQILFNASGLNDQGEISERCGSSSEVDVETINAADILKNATFSELSQSKDDENTTNTNTSQKRDKSFNPEFDNCEYEEESSQSCIEPQISPPNSLSSQSTKSLKINLFRGAEFGSNDFLKTDNIQDTKQEKENKSFNNNNGDSNSSGFGGKKTKESENFVAPTESGIDNGGSKIMNDEERIIDDYNIYTKEVFNDENHDIRTHDDSLRKSLDKGEYEVRNSNSNDYSRNLFNGDNDNKRLHNSDGSKRETSPVNNYGEDKVNDYKDKICVNNTSHIKSTGSISDYSSGTKEEKIIGGLTNFAMLQDHNPSDQLTTSEFEDDPKDDLHEFTQINRVPQVTISEHEVNAVSNSVVDENPTTGGMFEDAVNESNDNIRKNIDHESNIKYDNSNDNNCIISADVVNDQDSNDSNGNSNCYTDMYKRSQTVITSSKGVDIPCDEKENSPFILSRTLECDLSTKDETNKCDGPIPDIQNGVVYSMNNVTSPSNGDVSRPRTSQQCDSDAFDQNTDSFLKTQSALMDTKENYSSGNNSAVDHIGKFETNDASVLNDNSHLPEGSLIDLAHQDSSSVSELNVYISYHAKHVVNSGGGDMVENTNKTLEADERSTKKDIDKDVRNCKNNDDELSDMDSDDDTSQSLHSLRIIYKVDNRVENYSYRYDSQYNSDTKSSIGEETERVDILSVVSDKDTKPLSDKDTKGKFMTNATGTNSSTKANDNIPLDCNSPHQEEMTNQERVRKDKRYPKEYVDNHKKVRATDVKNQIRNLSIDKPDNADESQFLNDFSKDTHPPRSDVALNKKDGTNKLMKEQNKDYDKSVKKDPVGAEHLTQGENDVNKSTKQFSSVDPAKLDSKRRIKRRTSKNSDNISDIQNDIKSFAPSTLNSNGSDVKTKGYIVEGQENTDSKIIEKKKREPEVHNSPDKVKSSVPDGKQKVKPPSRGTIQALDNKLEKQSDNTLAVPKITQYWMNLDSSDAELYKINIRTVEKEPEDNPENNVLNVESSQPTKSFQFKPIDTCKSSDKDDDGSLKKSAVLMSGPDGSTNERSTLNKKKYNYQSEHAIIWDIEKTLKCGDSNDSINEQMVVDDNPSNSVAPSSSDHHPKVVEKGGTFSDSKKDSHDVQAPKVRSTIDSIDSSDDIKMRSKRRKRKRASKSTEETKSGDTQDRKDTAKSKPMANRKSLANHEETMPPKIHSNKNNPKTRDKDSGYERERDLTSNSKKGKSEKKDKGRSSHNRRY